MKFFFTFLFLTLFAGAAQTEHDHNYFLDCAMNFTNRNHNYWISQTDKIMHVAGNAVIGKDTWNNGAFIFMDAVINVRLIFRVSIPIHHCAYVSADGVSAYFNNKHNGKIGPDKIKNASEIFTNNNNILLILYEFYKDMKEWIPDKSLTGPVFLNITENEKKEFLFENRMYESIPEARLFLKKYSYHDGDKKNASKDALVKAIIDNDTCYYKIYRSGNIPMIQMSLIDVYYIEGHINKEDYFIEYVCAKTQIPLIGEVYLRAMITQ
ncbi:MAG TPA: hypothetical protein DC049_00230 [Spirochaetia bacterium]|nr:hypothetical protein [Spirochaetia bacterium]